MSYNAEDYIDKDSFSTSPCPYCEGKVEITTSRDISKVDTYAVCFACGANFCSVEASLWGKSLYDVIGISTTEVAAINFSIFAKNYDKTTMEPHHYPGWGPN